MRSGAIGRLIATLAALAIPLWGCIPGYVRVGLQTDPATNGSAPFYMLVRSVEPKQHAAQSYSEVASLLDAPDGSVVRTQLLYPGRRYRFYLKSPAKGALGLYFLFTSPGGSWKMLLTPPLPWQLTATLRGNLVSEELAR